MSRSGARAPAVAPATVSLASATAIVVGNMIGTGVFTSLGFQVAEIPSALLILLLWLIGGAVALCGALSYGELASAMPRSGGEYHFLSKALHPFVGFLSGWVSMTVGFAAPIALAAMAFGSYLHRVFPAADPLWTSLALVAAATVVFLAHVRLGSRFLNFFVVLKVTILLVLTASAFGFSSGDGAGFFARRAELDSGVWGACAIALVFVMYSYSGWNASTYVVNEIRNPRRNVARSLILGTAVVTAVYVAANAAFLYSTPASELAGELEVGLIVARGIFGAGWGDVMALLICVGLVSSVSAMTWAGPRVAMVMGEDYRGLSVFAHKSRSGIPWVAVLFQGAVASVLLMTSTFESVLTYIELILILSSFLTVLAVFLVRRQHPALDWPYKTWGYPVTPIVFLLVSLFIMGFVLRERPWESLFGLLTLVAGALVYLLVRSTRRAGLPPAS